MSRYAAEAVHTMYRAFNALAGGAGIERYVVAHWDPAGEYYPVEESEPVRGHAALIGWHRRWFEVWNEFHAQVDELIESDGPIMVGLTVEARGSATGLTLRRPFFHVIDLRDGRVARMREYDGRDEALRAAGLRDVAD
jgi:ketosteroid isomerase-like protein